MDMSVARAFIRVIQHTLAEVEYLTQELEKNPSKELFAEVFQQVMFASVVIKQLESYVVRKALQFYQTGKQ